LDDRQDILGQVSSFQASRPEEAADGEEGRQRTSAVQPGHSGQPKAFFSADEKLAPAAALPLGRQWRVTK